MSRRKEDLRVKEVPPIVLDPASKKQYTKGRFLGKGGFAKCYELLDSETNKNYAGKIVSKALLVKPHQKEKMSMEIAIHRTLHHKHIVGFHGFFEDDSNVYVLLELCRRRSLMELHKRRRQVTEAETRYFMQQIIVGVQYMHGKKVIHRDLKLGNLFIDDNMNIKIGDFGLATKEEYDGERKRTLCGTPNYIAPEVLTKEGHSFEVDSWSLGCIMYTLLVGRPPFETSSLKDTYQRIKRNQYHIPSKISPTARSLITRFLHKNPLERPDVMKLLEDDFFTTGHLPKELPVSCLTTAPRFSSQINRKPLTEVKGHRKDENTPPVSELARKPLHGRTPPVVEKKDLKDREDVNEDIDDINKSIGEQDALCHLPEMMKQLVKVLDSKPCEKNPKQFDEAEDPAAIPVLWVSKWVDYSDKYGLGYQLNDGSVGVLFNDSTRLLLHQNGENLEYIDREWNESYPMMSSYPESLKKKVTLLTYFRNYMTEHLLKTGATMTPRDSDALARLPFMNSWFRTRSAIVLHLSNGTMQINFFTDHTKIIVCPLMGAVTYIDQNRESRSFRCQLMEQYGCTRDLYSRIKYGRAMVERLIAIKSQPPSSQKQKKIAAPTGGQPKRAESQVEA
ncbi:serine/threonine-protein kinase PLK1-like isoform X1 [Apostichopus japonicus]|uniref:serine/threonine-protein kinase PLK1-like isoform X1 n=2 Tax=Stichopus japonicus TaxID=307972 RepID=UPI003AB5A65A